MKFQKIKTYALGLVIAATALTQYSCEADWLKEYEPTTLQQPSTATLAVNTIKDSTAMLDYSLSTVGRLYVVVVPGNNETATPAASTMLTLKTAGAVYKKQIILNDAAALAASIKITGLIQNTSYKVFALPVNEDGVQGEIITTDAFSTSDNYVPTLTLSTGVSPSISSAASQAVNFKPVLTFSEPVVLAETFTITYGYRSAVTGVITLVNVPKDSIKITSNKVTISQPKVGIYGQFVFLTIGPGAFLDRAGNAYAGVTSGIVNGKPTNIFWRNKLNPTVNQQILPKDSLQYNPSTFKIILDFPYKMRHSGSVAGEGSYDQTKVVVRYSSNGVTSEMQVPYSNVKVIQDTLVQITLPRTPLLGEFITFKMAEGAMRNSYDCPSAAIEFSKKGWLMSYGYSRSLILGNYTIGNLVSAFTGPSTDVLNVSIAALANDPKKVTISGLFGSDDDIIAVYDENLATFIIYPKTASMGQMLTFAAGHPYEDYEFEVWNGYTATNGIIKGSVSSNGTISMSGLGFYYYTTDGEDEGWFDLYSQAIWTKDVVKSNSNSDAFKPVINRGNMRLIK